MQQRVPDQVHWTSSQPITQHCISPSFLYRVCISWEGGVTLLTGTVQGHIEAHSLVTTQRPSATKFTQTMNTKLPGSPGKTPVRNSSQFREHCKIGSREPQTPNKHCPISQWEPSKVLLRNALRKPTATKYCCENCLRDM